MEQRPGALAAYGVRGAACRSCGAGLSETFADLGMSPLANSFIPPERVRAMEPFYPLHAWVCSACRLVQLEQFETPAQIFGDYLYFSSYSQSWLEHAQSYANAMLARFGLGATSLVVEIASNDGYLLQYFRDAGCRVLGVEPASNVAQVAIGRGIRTEVAFFGRETARRLRAQGVAADHMAANNVLAHVPDPNDFIAGFAELLEAQGVATFEFPHLLRLMADSQFDTIYHEHFSYLSLQVVRDMFARQGLRVFDVAELSTHGGSLRVFACHEAGRHALQPSVAALLAAERDFGLERPETYRDFAGQVVRVKLGLLRFLLEARDAGKRVAAYGAPAKGNTLLNYCGVGRELIKFTVDRSPHKQGMLLPGTRIPIRPPEAVMAEKPDYLLILPWNLHDEIREQMAGIREWGGPFRCSRSDLADHAVIFAETALPGVWLVQMERKVDARGHFARSFCAGEFASHGLPVVWAQCNVSFNARAGTLRGLHWQEQPCPEGKLIRCTAGAIFDVAVDLREGATRGRWMGVTLSASGGEALYIPPGCAHGFQVLEDASEVFYQMTERYCPDRQAGVRWDSPALDIAWPLANPVVSDRDAALPEFK